MRRLKVDFRNEQGGITVLVAILLGMGTLLGVAALSVDVGQLYAERRELQNGADAAALALAQSCAKGEATCTAATGPTSPAGTYANLNAKDGATRVESPVCGAGHPNLPPCPSTSGRWVDCLALPPAGTNFVQVRTGTRMTDGSTLFPRSFARVFVDGPATGTPVTACARANWGGVAAAKSSLAMTISLKEWQCMTAGGTSFAPPPPYPPIPASTHERVLTFHSTTGTGCPDADAMTGPSGWDLPGGFGWLDDTSGSDTTTDCSAYVSAGGTSEDDPGVSSSSACKAALVAAWTNKTVLYLPVFDGFVGGDYHFKGYAAFVVTGYRFPGGAGTKASWITGTNPCGPPKTCLSGFFTQGLVPASAVPVTGGPSMGANAVGMIG